MDVVTLQMAKADAAKKLRPLRRRDFRTWKDLPTLMASPPTFTLGSSGGATTISGSGLMVPWDASAFTYYGIQPTFASNSAPKNTGYSALGGGTVPAPYASGNTTAPPWAAEFDFDSSDGLFEVKMSGQGTGGRVRVLVNGQYGTQVATFAPPPDGTTYFGLVNLGAAGKYRIRLEFESSTCFYGVQTLPSNAVVATPKRAQRWIVIGDSFTEPTIQDSGGYHNCDGWTMQLAHLLGVDVWSAGKGGTGYLNPGSYVKYRSRLTDITAYSPDVIIWAGGINDYGTYTAAAIAAELLLCLQTAATALPNVQQIVLSPFWRNGFQTYPTNLLLTDDQMKSTAQSFGAIYLDLLRFPATRPRGDAAAATATTMSSASSVAASSISLPVALPLGTYVEIGHGTTAAEIRRITGVTGTGPYTNQFGGVTPGGGGGNLASAHSSGDAVVPVGPGFISGTGYQGAAQGDGTGDRMTGADHTHPTVAGHLNIAKVVANLLGQTLNA